MSRALYPRMTLARWAWLERLEREEIVRDRGKGPTGYHCMRLGWTQWVRGTTDLDIYGEALTKAGRQALAEWRESAEAGHPPTSISGL